MPDRIEDPMADLAFVFGWRPADMAEMEFTEILEWRERARLRYQPEE